MKYDPTNAVSKSNLLLPRAKHDHIQGSIDAPIALVEYGDYECPYCGQAYPIVKATQEQLGDRLCFAFRNFPLANSQLLSHAGAAASLTFAVTIQVLREDNGADGCIQTELAEGLRRLERF